MICCLYINFNNGPLTRASSALRKHPTTPISAQLPINGIHEPISKVRDGVRRNGATSRPKQNGKGNQPLRNHAHVQLADGKRGTGEAGG